MAAYLISRENPPSENWLYRYKNRHRELFAVFSRKISTARYSGVLKEVTSGHFELLE
jgi:hypothetical protein